MHRLDPSQAGVSICAGVSLLPGPPTSYAIVPAGWSRSPMGPGAVPELELAVWADAARSLTAVTFNAGIPRAFSPSAATVTGTAAIAGSLDLSTKTTNCTTVIAAALAGAAPTVPGDGVTIAFVQSDGAPNAGALTKVGTAYTFTFKNGVTKNSDFEAAIAASADLVVKTPAVLQSATLATTVDEFSATALAGAADAFLSHTAHGLLTGDGPFQLTNTGGAVPAGLALATDYWIVKDSANTFGVSTSLANALAGIVVEFSTNGTGTTTMTADATCARLHWHATQNIGLAGDGALTLDAQSSYLAVVKHVPSAVAYALVGTMGSGSGNVSAEVRPHVDS